VARISKFEDRFCWNTPTQTSKDESFWPGQGKQDVKCVFVLLSCCFAGQLQPEFASRAAFAGFVWLRFLKSDASCGDS